MTTPGSLNRTIRVTSSGLVLEDVVIIIDVQKTLDADPNESKVTFRNLSLDTERQFRRGDLVHVEAGQDIVQSVFTGQIIRFAKKVNKPDTEFTIFLERERVPTSQAFEENFPKGTPLTFVVTRLAQSIGLPLGNHSDVPVAILPNDLPIQDASADSALTGFLSSLREPLTWYVDEGMIHIASTNSVNPMFSKLLINGLSGMVGSPEVTDTGVDVKVLLDVPVSLNQLVEVESSSYVYGFEENSDIIIDTRGKQTYKVFGMRYQGDNWDGELTNKLRLETVIAT